MDAGSSEVEESKEQRLAALVRVCICVCARVCVCVYLCVCEHGGL